jgi:hypothetical protein
MPELKDVQLRELLPNCRFGFRFQFGELETPDVQQAF